VRLIVTLAHFLWQGAVVFVVAAAAAAFLRRASTNARYTVLVAALLLMAACPPVTFMLVGGESGGRSQRLDMGGAEGPASGEAVLHIPPAAAAHDPPNGTIASPRTASADWKRYAPHAVLGYLLGAAIMFARLLLAVYGGQRLRRRSQPVEDGTILMAFSRQARALGLSFTPAIAFCREVAAPTVVGVLRPMILLPLSLASGLTPGQVELLSSHEPAHIRRYDYLVNFLQRVIEAVLFFHPAVWLLSRRIRNERENCCDDMVLAAGGQRLAYAESLVRMAELSGGHSPLAPYMAAAALGADGRRSQLRDRITRLIAGPPSYEPVRLRRSWMFVLPVLATAALTLNCLVPARQTDSASAGATAAPGSGHTGAADARDPANAIPVRAWIDGTVAEVNVKAGQTVKKGDILVRFDDRMMKLETDQAKKRLQDLRDRHALLVQEYTAGLRNEEESRNAATDVKLAEIELERLALRMERTRILSPADGTIDSADGGLAGLTGAHVAAGQILLYVVPPGTMPPGMVGTWFFDNPEGDDEQMAVFPDGRVVVLYSNGHKDETRIVDGTITLAEYNNARVTMARADDGTLIQTSDAWNGFAKRWRRIDPIPRTELLRPLSGPPATQPAE
jgi:beta-lactamase regulating signal transducer with metallopeptidase domain